MKFRENFRGDSLAHEEIPTKQSKAMMKEIKNHFKYIFSFSYRELTLNNQFYSKLPADFQTQVIDQIVSHSNFFTQMAMTTFSQIFERFSIFFDFFTDPSFKKEIASRLKPKM